MKKAIFASAFLFLIGSAHAQNDQLRAVIQGLEQKSKKAILEKDSATLHTLWAPDFLVNAPTNKVVKGEQVAMVMRGQISYSSFTGEIEEMLVTGDFVITMGHETVVPLAGSPNAGQNIQRRYTHIWKKTKDSWLLIARHAHEVCR
ncbi:MAG TPA: nuclear transport factor 2 family protein [Chitinophagaceae bacterium]|nr:nuclear transport factor 2 family protein [Chitinophagaceae bacterium]